MKKSLTGRWLKKSITVVAMILVFLIAFIAMIAMSYYYNTIEYTLKGHAIGFENYVGDSINTEDEFIMITGNYVENFQYKDQLELMILDSENDVVLSSSGFRGERENIESIISYQEENQIKVPTNWIGRLGTGEKAMVLIKPVYSDIDVYLGSIYYMVSLEKADTQILIAILIFIGLFAMIITIAMVASTYFLKDILQSVKSVSSIAKNIAQGNFEATIEKKYDDEIGELCDNINYMAKELAQSEQIKNDFISSVSHELRTPLTAINGWAETMRLGGNEKTMQKGLGIIIKETRRLSGIVEELLDFSRMQNDKMVLMPEKMDIIAELDEAVYMYNERAISEGKHLIFESPESVSPIFGDKNRLKQVFANLIDNALKYTPKEGVITVSVEENEGKVYVMIRDNGCGIPSEHLPKITEKFYKVNNSQRGSGIGLAVVDEIIRLHSGTLTIESTEGEGTTVIIALNAIEEETE